jgi:peptidoglycan/xylan/chitin deacetylase (PgdA/CDA1 family)
MLMYHAVKEGISDRRPYYETNVSPAVFASQIRQLRDDGYQAVSLKLALEALHNGECNHKLVVISFDDGYQDFYQNAFPILAECQFTATVFLMSGYVSDESMIFKDKKCLTWCQVRELHAQGINFGSHTVTHPQLQMLSREQVSEEIVNSKKTIEDHLGAEVSSFSYPYAFPEADKNFKSWLRDALLKSGYQNGVTTILGTANPHSDRMFLPRLPVNLWDDARFFRAKFEGGYDWLHAFQYAAKLIHSKVN